MHPDSLIIRREMPADYAAAEYLTREAFWNVYRPGCNEHYILHVLRHDPACVPELDLVLEQGSRLIGQILYLRARIRADDGRDIPVLTFGPLSIHPDCQGRGYGRYLLEQSMARARALGAGALCIEGDAGFYGRSGFVPAGARGIRCHGAPAGQDNPHFLLRELRAGFLQGVTGVYHTPRGYFVDETAAEEFDRRFSPKPKRKLPGQLF